MFDNFVGVSLDSVMNEGALLRYMLGGQVSVPMVIKTAIGAVASNAVNGGGTAAQHSGSMYSLFAHISRSEMRRALRRVHRQGSVHGGNP